VDMQLDWHLGSRRCILQRFLRRICAGDWFRLTSWQSWLEFAGAGGELADRKTGAAGATAHEILCVERAVGMALDVCDHGCAFPAVLGGFVPRPESPRWLATKGRNKQALAVLERLGGRTYAEQVLRDFAAASATETNSSFYSELSSPGMARCFSRCRAACCSSGAAST